MSEALLELGCANAPFRFLAQTLQAALLQRVM
jgi:hypothetical protein